MATRLSEADSILSRTTRKTADALSARACRKAANTFRALEAMDKAVKEKQPIHLLNYDIGIERNADVPNPSAPFRALGLVKYTDSHWAMTEEILNCEPFQKWLAHCKQFNRGIRPEAKVIVTINRVHDSEVEMVYDQIHENARQEVVRLHTRFFQALDGADRKLQEELDEVRCNRGHPRA